MSISNPWYCSWPRGYLRGLLLVLLLVVGRPLLAHPMPNSLVLLDMQPGGVAAELQVPLGELQPAFGYPLLDNPAAAVARFSPELRAYLRAHIRPVSPDGRPWTVQVGELRVQEAEQTATGPYQELTAQVWLQPPAGASARSFQLHYDAVVHQVVTHVALVSVRRDWAAGRVGEAATPAGVIRLDVRRNVIPPLLIDEGTASGGWWAGFRGMVALGVRHIAEGTDHLLFLLMLLLPAPLLVAGGQWGRFGGLRYTVGRLARVVTAFTVGHSLTLLAGALGWLRLPAQPVEVLIAGSILISAVHAVRPLFAGREALVAAGFGLVHGLAFASTLAGLHLAAGPLALSILGFNLGIELLQLLLVALAGPGLLLLARTRHYLLLRGVGAAAAGVAALVWVVERVGLLPTSLPGSLAVPAAGTLAVGVLLTGLHFTKRPARQPVTE